jgi:hypothetical protein
MAIQSIKHCTDLHDPATKIHRALAGEIAVYRELLRNIPFLSG